MDTVSRFFRVLLSVSERLVSDQNTDNHGEFLQSESFSPHSQRKKKNNFGKKRKRVKKVKKDKKRKMF